MRHCEFKLIIIIVSRKQLTLYLKGKNLSGILWCAHVNVTREQERRSLRLLSFFGRFAKHLEFVQFTEFEREREREREREN